MSPNGEVFFTSLSGVCTLFLSGLVKGEWEG